MKKQKQIVVVVVGLPCSGKSTMVRELRHRLEESAGISCYCCKISDIIKSEVAQLGLPILRFHVVKIGEQSRSLYGADYWAHRLVCHLSRKDEQVVLIEGVWIVDELKTLKRVFGKDCFTVGLEVSQSELNKRLEKRFSKLPPDKRCQEIERVKLIYETFKFAELIGLVSMVVNNNQTEGDLSEMVIIPLCKRILDSLV